MEWRLVLSDQRPEVLEPWRLQFAEIPEAEVLAADPLEAPGDALLVPGNSFGFLDRGFELRVVDAYGFEVQDALRAKIRSAFFGEILVGQAVVVETPKAPRPIVYAPLWRIPSRLEGTVNVYLAVRGALLALGREGAGEGAKRLVVPALGIGPPGELHPGVSARQARYAYEVVAGRRGFGDKNLSQIARRQKKLQSIPGSLRGEDAADS